MRILPIAFRFGMVTGSVGGLLAGLVAAIFGGLFTSSRADLSAFSASVFLLLVVLLPALFFFNIMVNPSGVRVRPFVRQNSYRVALLAWLPALGLSIIVFMMPVTLAPLVLNKGVTFENVGEWYSQVQDALLGWRIVLVAIVALVGFGGVALMAHTPME